MPTRPKRPCNHIHCRNLVEPGERYCPDHKTEVNRWVKRNRKDREQNRFYDSAAWKRLRRFKLNEAPLCERCFKKGYITPATIVHHKAEIRKGGDYLPTVDELESLCKSCHSKEHGGW